MKLYNFSTASKNAARAKALRIMKIALMICVGIIAGVIVVAYAGEAILALGAWTITIAFYMAVGMAVVSMTTTFIGFVATMLMNREPKLNASFEVI
jgi:hypothetical protein